MDLTILQIFFILVVGIAWFFASGFVTFYFSLMSLTTLLMEKAIPEEVVEQAVGKIETGWMKWLTRMLLSLVRSRFIEIVYRLIKVRKQVVGFFVLIVGGVVLFIALLSLTFATYFFAEVPLVWVTGSTLVSGAVGWFFTNNVMDKSIGFLVRKIRELLAQVAGSVASPFRTKNK